MSPDQAQDTLYNAAIKYMDCMDVDQDDPQRNAVIRAFIVLVENRKKEADDRALLDWVDSKRNADYPRFVANVSKVGMGFHMKSCHRKYEAGDVRSALRKAMAKDK